MRFFKGLAIFSGMLVLALFAWFFSINGSFHSSTLKIETVNYAALSVKEHNLIRECVGFVAVCEIPTLGLKVISEFTGFSFSKPSPGFLNLSGWGDHRGLHWQETYFGSRHIKIITISGHELGKLSQFLWNTGEYSDLSQVLAVDLTNKKIFVAAGNLGFVGTTDIGWAMSLKK